MSQYRPRVELLIVPIHKTRLNVTIRGGGNAVHVLAACVNELPDTHTAVLKCNDYFPVFKEAVEKHYYKFIAKHNDGRPDICESNLGSSQK